MNIETLTRQFPQTAWDVHTRSVIVPHVCLLDVVYFLKTDPEFSMDYVSNVTGVDWLARKEKTKGPDGKESEIEKPGFLEVVYHFYSMREKRGPVILRCRTDDRENPMIPSITPLFRGAEFQEREIYDLYGIRFSGHPDLRRILMWDEFQDFPMRKDYQEPDDYEWEPTPHDEVLDRAKQHYAAPHP
ncbi:MAG: NADH-quinone oxidoreductase subunit C [Verrucomicrobia bacterium]|nr:NADH-quinone oxidoreductase subunit C [Verrucomicrobiota bacterium]